MGVETHKIPTAAVTGSLDLSTDSGITMARIMVAIANKSSRDTARIVEWLVGCLGKVDHPEPPMSKPHNRSRTRRDQLLRFAIGTSMRKETARALQPANVDGCAVKSNLADDSAH